MRLDPATVAGGGEQTLGREMEGVDYVVTRRPEFARRAQGAEFVHFGAVGNEAIAAGSRHRARGDDGNGRGGHGDTLHGQRRQAALGFFSHRRHVQAALWRLRQGSDFAFGSVEDHHAFTVFADAVHQSAPVTACNQTSIRLEEQAADVLLVAFEVELGVAGCVDFVDRGGSAGSYEEGSLRVEGEVPDVFGLLVGFGFVGEGCRVKDYGCGCVVEAGLAG